MNKFGNFFDNLFPLRPLFPFVQSVLPTVFDDSLSYLEVLGKVVKALNDTESNVNTLEQAVRAFADDLATFENLTIYPVNMTFDQNTGNYTADKTFADIDAALLEGRTPVLHVIDRYGQNYYTADLKRVTGTGVSILQWSAPIFYADGALDLFQPFINSSDVTGIITQHFEGDSALVVSYNDVPNSDVPDVDTSFADIAAALEDEKPVFLFVNNINWVPLARATRAADNRYTNIDFISALPVSTTGGNNLGVAVYSVNESDTWSVTRYAFPDSNRVNTLIDIKLAQLEGFESVKKLEYNETTGAVKLWDGESYSPITGAEIIVNILSQRNVYPFLEGTVNGVFNLYIPLDYNTSVTTEAVRFYRVYNNNLEIVSVPSNSNIASKRTVALGGTDPLFLITAVYSNGQYTFDRNQADILSAIQSGKLPVVRYHTTAGQSDYHVYYEWVFDYYAYDGEDVYIYFSRIDQSGKNAQLRWVGSENKATEMAWPNLPAATGADNGKVPMVNSFGNYQLMTPSGSAGVPVITNSDSIAEVSIDPNKFYIFTAPDMLSIDFNAGTSGIVNEYHFRFTSGSSATQLDLPTSVVIPDDFDVAADTVYEVSIIDNYMVYSSWAVNA